MKHNYNNRPNSGLKIAAMAVIALSAILTSGMAGQMHRRSPVIGPPKGPYLTHIYMQLSVAFQQWRWSVIRDTGLDPWRNDPTGVLCGVNQHGPVWFITGAPVEPDNPEYPVVRYCTIPKGKYLHFPIVNGAWITNSEAGAEQIADPDFFQFINEFIIGSFTADDVVLSAEIDGKAVPNLRNYFIQSPIFELDNFGSLEDGYLNFDFGYYLLLSPLKEGVHTLKFAGAHALGASDVTYVITVDDDDDDDHGHGHNDWAEDDDD